MQKDFLIPNLGLGQQGGYVEEVHAEDNKE